jgi:hypothetical protein
VQTASGIRDSEVRDVHLKKRKKEATQDADPKNSDEHRERLSAKRMFVWGEKLQRKTGTKPRKPQRKIGMKPRR